MTPVRVLLVDDVPDIRRVIGRRLVLDGRFVVVGEAEDGAQAVSLAVVHEPDVIVLDLAMPVMDGLEALREIRARAPDTKVVVLSGFESSKVVREALELGASAYLEKGTGLTDIAATLADVCGATDAEQAEGNVPPADLASQLTAYVVHELQTPVAIMSGFAQTLLSDLDGLDPDTIRQCAEAIDRNATSLGELLRRFNDVRAIDKGTLAVEPVRTDLPALVREVVDDLAAVTAGRPVHVSLDEPCLAHVDTGRIRQILTNLVKNAARYGHGGTAIRVELRTDDHTIRIAVADRGPGVPAGRAADVFEKFVRLDRNIKGTGIGLYIARGIARAHGGDLRVDETYTGGARFVLTLPAERRVAEVAS